MSLVLTEMSLLLPSPLLLENFLPLRNLNICFSSLEAVFQTVGFLGDNNRTQEISAWFSIPGAGWVDRCFRTFCSSVETTGLVRFQRFTFWRLSMSGQWLHNLDGVITNETELARPGSTRCSFKLHGTRDEVTFLLLKPTDLPCESLSLLLELGIFSTASHQDLLSGKKALISWVSIQESLIWGGVFRASLD